MSQVNTLKEDVRGAEDTEPRCTFLPSSWLLNNWQPWIRRFVLFFFLFFLMEPSWCARIWSFSICALSHLLTWFSSFHQHRAICFSRHIIPPSLFTYTRPSHSFLSIFIIPPSSFPPTSISPSLFVLLFPSLYILQAYPPVSDKKVIRLLMASISFPLLSWQSFVYCIPEDSLCCC